MSAIMSGKYPSRLQGDPTKIDTLQECIAGANKINTAIADMIRSYIQD